MLIEPVLRSPLQSPLQSPFGGIGSFTAAVRAALFGASEQGAFYDPSDFSTLFQDSAGTTPVTAAGQPVGRMLDKSGRGNHATQPTAAARPTLQQDASGFWHLRSDGVDDWMQTGSIDLSATDKMAVWVGVNKQSDAATACLMEFSTDWGLNNGTFSLFAPPFAASSQYRFTHGGTTKAQAVSTAAFAAPITNVLCGVGDIAAPSAALRINGAANATVATTQGTGNLGSFPLYLFARAGTSLFLNGRFYGGIIRAGAPTAAQIALGERWAASKCGVSLP